MKTVCSIKKYQPVISPQEFQKRKSFVLSFKKSPKLYVTDLFVFNNNKKRDF